MLFLLRSAFWLTLAFILIAPRDQDPAQLPRSVVSESLSALQEQAETIACQDVACVAGKATLTVLAAPKSPSDTATMQAGVAPVVPLPRRRPDRMG